MDHVRLDGGAMTLVLALEAGGTADLVYLGARLPETEDLAALAAATARGRHESQPDTPPRPGLLPERKGGWSGAPAMVLRKDGTVLDTDFRVSRWEGSEKRLEITLRDERLGAELTLTREIGAGDAVSCAAHLENTGAETFALDHLASLALPIPHRFTHMTSFSGRWAGEMREHYRPIAPEGFSGSSAIGKPGFTGSNWVLLHDPISGEALGAHLAWSGDHITTIDCDTQGAADGRSILQMAPIWEEGSVVLEPGYGSSVYAPKAVFVWGKSRHALTQNFHRHVRQDVLRARALWDERKVHLNTWEALGFDLSTEAIMGLADEAARLGVERFVLDDGWFGGRRNDQTSLGDWHVAVDLDLDAVIAHVHSLGMDFGLWVEPEMVSPDSDLYRAHPEWCLHGEGDERPTMRGQLVLDLSNPDASNYVAERLKALKARYPIAIFKWDHNRDLFPAAKSALAQTHHVLAMMRQLQRFPPAIEIESCASGGGRIALDMLKVCQRVWPSDNNDPIERVRIMRAWSQFLPLEVLGNHVGPSPNPITGRRTDIDFRAKVALFGHMGIEADPGAMSDHERQVLAAHIALYKAWRGVLHAGDWFALDHPDPGIFAQIVVDGDRALAVAAQTGFAPAFDAAPLRLTGLEANALYRVTLPRPWPGKASLYLADWQAWEAGLTLSGAALMGQGLALPLTHPETAWIIALEKLPA